ncbi:class I SAM-dependent RNA methyltransferase [uncultured Gimesia sp.]|jgi:putative N6-adenine-specific DNA methylase|uniref:THUMP domain-containing class I SAM-dependent RNA methyltransferase n=1 Tax=uncultured Gimesia sp. TaxID=1678688 RepID=UPI0026322B6B|nr:class I SAM-dependent RNA methyltransferase [uncultured Gimesia sp.]
MSEPLTLVATSAFGLEAVVSRELKQLGYEEQTIENGRVTFQGDLNAICRCNLWLRSADRVMISLGEFTALDFDDLFEETRDLEWERWLPPSANFPVRASAVRSKIDSPKNTQKMVKKAIAERLKDRYIKDWFPEDGPLYSVNASILKDRVSICVDTTGPSLHKRGYRKLVAGAQLKETLAAGLIQLSYWNRERPFVDPCCGSGTIPIEAALIGTNTAPGINREFACEGWQQFPAEMWNEARDEARDLQRNDITYRLLGYDIDPAMIRMARYHAQQAGMEEFIHFQDQPLSEFSTPRKYGCIITNPPYGERLGEKSDAEVIYREMKRVFEPLEMWSIYVLTSHPGFERIFGQKARRRKLYNGRIECVYYQFPGPPPPRKKSPWDKAKASGEESPDENATDPESAAAEIVIIDSAVNEPADVESAVENSAAENSGVDHSAGEEE